MLRFLFRMAESVSAPSVGWSCVFLEVIEDDVLGAHGRRALERHGVWVSPWRAECPRAGRMSPRVGGCPRVLCDHHARAGRSTEIRSGHRSAGRVPPMVGDTLIEAQTHAPGS